MRAAKILCLWLATSAPWAYGWGERGHDVVAKVATRLVASHGMAPAVAKVFVANAEMLGTLAYAPDYYWRDKGAVGKAAVKKNRSTHYLDIDHVQLEMDFKSFPRTLPQLVSRVRSLCEDPVAGGYRCPLKKNRNDLTVSGTAPWRIAQLYRLMKERLTAFAKAKKKQDYEEALKFAGLMAHFVGDLANPYHGSRNYDGWDTEQGGVHAYFETHMVDVLPMGLTGDVYERAIEQRPSQRLLKVVGKGKGDNPLEVSLALVFDSFAQFPKVLAMDRQHALIKPSQKAKGMRIPAKRKSPKEASSHFREIIAERLAAGADALAYLWVTAWKVAGKPDLSRVRSYRYFTRPAFIEPDYLGH